MLNTKYFINEKVANSLFVICDYHNSDAVYCSIYLCKSHLKYKMFTVSLLSKLNIKHLYSDSSQMAAKCTNTKSAARVLPNTGFVGSHHRHHNSHIFICCFYSCHCQNLSPIFSAFHTIGAFVLYISEFIKTEK